MTDPTQLLNELRFFTAEFIANYMPDISRFFPPSIALPKDIPFNPKGAIVHISRTPSAWNTLNLLVQRIFGTHFVIMSANIHEELKIENRYPLVNEFPTTVLMIHDPTANIPHSGFMSTETWGIDLRSTGILRPHAFKTAIPLTRADETDRNFSIDFNNPFLSWRHHGWTTPFMGRVYNREGFYFECPSNDQVNSLVMILKLLDSIHPMDTSKIVPSNCVSGKFPVLQSLYWDNIRAEVKRKEELVRKPVLVSASYIDMGGSDNDEREDIPSWDESILADQLDEMRWRAASDDGQLIVVNADGLSHAARMYHVSDLATSALKFNGYPTDPRSFQESMALYSASRGLLYTPQCDVEQTMTREMIGGVYGNRITARGDMR